LGRGKGTRRARRREWCKSGVPEEVDRAQAGTLSKGGRIEDTISVEGGDSTENTIQYRRCENGKCECWRTSKIPEGCAKKNVQLGPEYAWGGGFERSQAVKPPATSKRGEKPGRGQRRAKPLKYSKSHRASEDTDL